MKNLTQLFLTFLKIGAFTFGGGYAMLPILQREIVEKKAWISGDDLANYYAIGQTTPGIIAVNTATFIGYRNSGILGAIVSVIGLILPGVLIVIGIVSLMTEYAQKPEVIHGIKGIKVAVTVLILDALLNLRKKSLIDVQTKLIFFIILGGILLFPTISPVVLVAFAGGLGVLLAKYKGGKE